MIFSKGERISIVLLKNKDKLIIRWGDEDIQPNLLKSILKAFNSGAETLILPSDLMIEVLK